MSASNPGHDSASAEQLAGDFRNDVGRLKAEIAKVIVGNESIVEGVLTCLLAGGHALLEGVPGLGKTMMVRTLAEAVDVSFSRIQFTPDLMPADIIGTNVIVDDSSARKHVEFQRGPVFSNIVLADEINRATPKTQSALLEAMQEHRVTISKTSYTLEQPFLVLATQNPLEMEGTYPLPEAQLDRFLYKLLVDFPSRDQMLAILQRTTASDHPHAAAVLGRKRLLQLREVLRQVPVARMVQEYAVRLLEATHPGRSEATESVKSYVRYGSSPRGAQALLLGGKMRAVLQGRFAVSTDDVRGVAHAALRHRILLNFEGEAEGVKTDQIIDELLERLPPQAP